MGLSALTLGGVSSNHLDIAPRHAGEGCGRAIEVKVRPGVQARALTLGGVSSNHLDIVPRHAVRCVAGRWRRRDHRLAYLPAFKVATYLPVHQVHRMAPLVSRDHAH